ncbi:MAG TPA: Ku protein [Candidatus Dormibacteraeota bacterium]|nr:Ku protein [Candidatus Dormibacteraeota bacterium]
MPTSIWTGSLSFGLVVIPVRLYPAVRRKVVRFHELDQSGRRVRHVRVSEPEAEEWYPPPLQDLEPHSSPHEPPAAERTRAPEVPYQEIRKGYEVAPGQHVSLSREEVEALAPERSRVIEVEQFVGTEEVDPVYFESRYYVAPDREALKAFRLLRDAMSESERMAIAWITLRRRRYLSAIRPYGDVMLLTTMVHADEVLPVDFWMPASDASPTERELKMARMLIDALAAPFNAEGFTDEHRARVLRAVAERTPVEAPSAPPSPTRVLDLMAALEASVKAAKAARKESTPRPSPARRRARGG